MTLCKIRGVREAAKRRVGTLSSTRKPRHVDNALVAISHIHRRRRREHTKYFPVEFVLQTIELLHARSGDSNKLGKYCGRNLENYILKALEKGGYVRFDETRTKLRVSRLAAKMMLPIYNQYMYGHSSLSPLQRHRAHCDYYRQSVGTVSRMPYKELERLHEELEQQHAEHLRTCQGSTNQSNTYPTPADKETEFSVTPPSSSSPYQGDDDENPMQEVQQMVAGPSSIPTTPAPIRRQNSAPNPENAYMTPASLPPRRLQRTTTQPMFEHHLSPSLLGRRGSFAARNSEIGNPQAAPDEMDVDEEGGAGFVPGPSGMPPGRTPSEHQAHATKMAELLFPNADTQPSFQKVEEKLEETMIKSHLKDAQILSQGVEIEETKQALLQGRDANKRLTEENIDLDRQLVSVHSRFNQYVGHATDTIKRLREDLSTRKDRWIMQARMSLEMALSD